MISDDIKALRVFVSDCKERGVSYQMEHYPPMISRVLDALEKRTEALERIAWRSREDWEAFSDEHYLCCLRAEARAALEEK